MCSKQCLLWYKNEVHKEGIKNPKATLPTSDTQQKLIYNCTNIYHTERT